ncbi:GPI-anchored mannoprotein [Datura stramonium]|uniref:GPI-anchored mannoprotein n=1 Tax=Datura stramonium TaxID=4076 RepID=A0ABS8SWU0_DATST|nr:GPI-anchored mannoprotein [Datura stramonium]
MSTLAPHFRTQHAVSPSILIRRFPDSRSCNHCGSRILLISILCLKVKRVFLPWVVSWRNLIHGLRKLGLRECCLYESLELISKSFKNFKVLVLQSCEGFTTGWTSRPLLLTAGVLSLTGVKSFNLCIWGNLRELDLGESEVEDLSGHWLSHFPDSCTSLVSLNIACLASEVSFSALERLVARSPHLRTLRLNRAVSIEKLPKLLLAMLRSWLNLADVSEVFVNVSQAFRCNQLKGLEWFLGDVPAYFPTIYPVQLQAHLLESLSYATIQIPELGKLISDCHNLQRLWVLDYIEDSGLEEIANSCKELQELRVFPSDPFAPGLKCILDRARPCSCLSGLP